MPRQPKQEKVAKLKAYFKKRDDVAMAFLFGSRAAGRAHGGSDWDIAVYFKTKGERIEWEEQEREYPQEDRIWNDCRDILRTDNIDIVVLNRVPATIADAALRGEPIIIKDSDLWREFMLAITGAADDFREFARDYHDMYSRSASLTAQDADRLQRSIEFIESQMALYAVFAPMPQEEYEKDLIKRGAVERWIENIINAVAEISKIILSSSKKPSPYGYADTIRTASLYLDLQTGFWDKFLSWVKLRNMLAHEYLDIKWKRIGGFIAESKPQVVLFADAAKKFLKENRTP